MVFPCYQQISHSANKLCRRRNISLKTWIKVLKGDLDLKITDGQVAWRVRIHVTHLDNDDDDVHVYNTFMNHVLGN